MMDKEYRIICDFETVGFVVPREFITPDIEEFIANKEGIYQDTDDNGKSKFCRIGIWRSLESKSLFDEFESRLLSAGYKLHEKRRWFCG